MYYPPPKAFGAVADYWMGVLDGSSEAKAYQIDSYEDFREFCKRVNNKTDGNGKFYIQTKDIEIPTTATGWNQIGSSKYYAFNGHYNGNGKKITNAMKNSYKEPLFGYIDERVGGYAIKNLSYDYVADPYDDTNKSNIIGALAYELIQGTIDNVKVNATVRYNTNYYPIGGIVGTVRKNGVVKNCVFNGSVRNEDSSSHEFRIIVGGITGLLKGGQIENCLVSLDVEGVSAGNSNYEGTSYYSYAGGVVGVISGDASKVTNCAVKGKVYSDKYAGGIAGYVNGGTVLSCYVLDGSNVESNIAAGGIAGYLRNKGVISADKIVMTSKVQAKETAVGGIV